MTSTVAYEAPLLGQAEFLTGRRNLLALLVSGYVLLLPYQFKVGSAVNFAPADCFLVLCLLLAPGQLRLLAPSWSIWHLGIAVVFAMGSLVCAMEYGSLAPYEFVNKDIGLFLPFLSYLAITSVVKEWEDVRRILRIFVYTVAAQNILAIGGYLAGYFYGAETMFVRYDGLRLSGMLLDPNAYGGLLAAALLVAEAASTGPAPLLRKGTLLVVRTTLALGLLFTFSRSAWTGLGLALVVLFFLRPVVLVRIALTALAGVPAVLLLMGSRFVPIVEEMAARPKQVQERFDLIQQAIEAFRHHPFLGGGLGSFRLSAGEIAHNSAMWFLADFGLLGLTIFFCFLTWFFARAWTAYQGTPPRERPLALALLLAHTAMTGVAMGIEAFYQRHWWLVMALIAAPLPLRFKASSNPIPSAKAGIA